MAESEEEWNEAKRVNARLIELGEMPVVAIEDYPVITDIKEMLEYDRKDSEEALPMMSRSLALFEDDFVTKFMIQQFIVDKQEHYNWVKQRGEYELGEMDGHGQRINIVINLKRRETGAMVPFVSGWMSYPSGKLVLITPFGGRV